MSSFVHSHIPTTWKLSRRLAGHLVGLLCFPLVHVDYIRVVTNQTPHVPLVIISLPLLKFAAIPCERLAMAMSGALMLPFSPKPFDVLALFILRHFL